MPKELKSPKKPQGSPNSTNNLKFRSPKPNKHLQLTKPTSKIQPKNKQTKNQRPKSSRKQPWRGGSIKDRNLVTRSKDQNKPHKSKKNIEPHPDIGRNDMQRTSEPKKRPIHPKAASDSTRSENN